MTGHTDRGRDGYVCGAAKYRRGLGCGSSMFVEKQVVETATWESVKELADMVASARGKRVLAKLNDGLRKEWEERGGKAASAARKRLQQIDEKIANVRAALEGGLKDVAWANHRLDELGREREAALATGGSTVGPAAPPRVDEAELRRSLADVVALMSEATNEEKRELARRFLDGVTLYPDQRELEVRVKLPANTVQRVEAATGIEPVYKSFADSCLTTWLRRHGTAPRTSGLSDRPARADRRLWSGKRDSNPRPSAWEADALPTELFPLRVPSTDYVRL